MKKTWWKEAVVYQVYWRSFYDTDGDGYGDLEGVIQKLDYIRELGVDIVWLNPCYGSPDVDNGYDISDYRYVMAKAGTMDTFEKLLQEVHARGMKLIMDLVVNHTSDQHPWFVESRSSKDNPKRDYYIWRKKANNWRSYFTPSTWEYDDRTGEYYFHSFAIEQPDLNWENPKVREEIYDMMRFWLDKGIDGFRMDVINLLAKQAGFPDAENPEHISYLGNNPGIHDYLQEMHEKVLKHYDIFTVGEIPFVTPEDGVLYVGEDRGELHTLFHFEVADDMAHWDMLRFKDIQKRWVEGMWGKGWNSQFLNNHDHTRLVTRFGNDTTYRVESAKCFATLLHTLPGMPYIYQGEEIGMTGVRFDSIEDYYDIAMKNKYKEEVEKGRDPKEVFESLLHLARDNSRTPVQWDDSKNAGFTSGTPWIKVNPNYKEINVAAALADPDSVFYYYKKLIQLRKEHEVMVYGSYEPLLEDHQQIYTYLRVLDNEKWLVILNISDQTVTCELPESISSHTKEMIISNYPQSSDRSDSFKLNPYEARIYCLK
ncbi:MULTISPECIES: alpha-glucosidase [unclassified Paenibacillus]|uniref:glycoside hydrolase family 13 protein n=1 Tax=unclassified Paenibacillus TaxID=185978 RepID=UPI001AE27F82|nr:MULTISPECIES: alpha-glucosidase [unclassified Paenibacillus]MBP1154126.1 oligo-1,6-glucosidase [Paenibacillus sp. PvP091]MBP1170489.1 oligo-1,6-glucosidase [Paenibacillus sp. PvR098]MBP2441517.1 oligo-1,6-glucosidase [Paenibacillus sp. PvP052]